MRVPAASRTGPDRGVGVFDLILADNMAAAMHKLHTKPKPQTPELTK